MFKVMKRECPMFGIGPYVCEFICDTASDITTLPTSISEGTGGRTAYDNQKCASGSIAIIASGSESKQYMLNNQDIWCPYSVAAGSSSGGSSESSITVDFALSETSENPVANKTITAALNDKAATTHTHTANEVGADTSGSAASALVEAKAYTDSEIEILNQALNNKANVDDLPDLSAYALKSKYGDTTIDVGRKEGTVVGIRSTAEGQDTTASDACSHAEGSITVASGVCSHAEGVGTVASGIYSHSEGDGTTASGVRSHAGGGDSVASGDSSFAHGKNAQALNDHEVAFGQYNISYPNSLFSVGDGTSESTRHNAFDITKTGGYLHDKHIATIDDIPDLTPYAKKTDVPGIKVNEAANADTVGGKSASQFLTGAAFSNLTASINDCYAAGTYSIEEQYTPNFPVGYGTFGLLDVRVYGSIIYQTIKFENGKIIHRAKVLGATDWTEWAEIYTSGNKPYVAGSVTVEANSTTCTPNHGFMPSGVIWWDVYASGIGLGLSETSFNMACEPQSVNRTVNYLIFK